MAQSSSTRPASQQAAGEAPRLGVALRQRHVTMISLGGIIGAGLFVGSSATLNTVGPAACLSYLVAGIVVLLVMRMLGEMALAVPGVGSFTEYARIGLGDWAGFTSGWLYWYFWVIVVAVEAVAGAAILQRWIPAPVWMIGLVLLSVMTFVNLMSVKSYGEFEFWFASIKVAAIIVFIAIGAAWLLGFHHVQSAWTNLTALHGFLPFGALSVFAAVPTVIFAVGGAEIATIAAAESDNPAKSVAAMTRSVILRVITFYVGSMFLIACIVPWTHIVTGHSPFVASLETMRVPGAADIMNAIVLVAVLSALNSGLYVSSRILFRLAERRDAPKALLRLTPSRVPRLAVLLSSVVGYVAIVVAIVSPQGVFLFLVNASGAVMLFVYLATALAQIRIRRRLEQRGEHPELPMWLFPWLSYAVVAAIVGVLIAMGTNHELRPQLMASVASLAIASAAWLLAGSRRSGQGDKQHEGQRDGQHHAQRDGQRSAIRADAGTRTGFLADMDGHALPGER